MKNALTLHSNCGECPVSVGDSSIGATDGPAHAMILLLDQLSDVVRTLSDQQYTVRPVGTSPSSVGAHVRHCLDHVRSLLTIGLDGILDYDRRERGTDIELDRTAALEAISGLSSQLADLSDEMMDNAICVCLRMSVDGAPIVTASSFGRELAYVLSHTIHHNAIVGGMVKTLGVTPPETFGYAPSTLRAAKVCS